MMERLNSCYRSRSFNQREQTLGRVLSIGSPRVSRRSFISHFIRSLVVIGALISFLLAVSGGCVYVNLNLSQTFHGYGLPRLNGSMDSCDVFDGSWMWDDNHISSYNASECPFAEQGFNCLGNGRKDKDYLKWRWKPRNCDIPRFPVQSILENFRNKRIVFVGDSMSRTQWESLICLLMSGVTNKKSVYEVNGNKITKQIRYLGVRFSSFNFTIEFFRSVYLVQHNWTPKHGPRRVKSTLRLDKLDDISNMWVNSDVLIFNTGQWWVPGKLFETGCYFQVGGSMKLGMSIGSAYRTAIGTWASWIDSRIDKNRTQVFFRTFEPSHWSNLKRRVCNVTQFPMSETEGRDKSIFSDAIAKVVKTMEVPVTVLRITSMSAFRRDAHVGNWSDQPSLIDCSHWCLPGIPDTWNEVMLVYLLAKNAFVRES